jgi:hypothetical protein
MAFGSSVVEAETPTGYVTTADELAKDIERANTCRRLGMIYHGSVVKIYLYPKKK